MSYDEEPLSKTAKYKKITKPLLERKRRARINRCLDEIKDLMVGALEIHDDDLNKLEKADILELTVNHLMKLHGPKDPQEEATTFQAGFGQCATEACRFVMAMPDMDTNVKQNLINHLSRMASAQPLTIQVPHHPPFSPPISPSSDSHHYYSDPDVRSSSCEEDSIDGGPSQWGSYSNNREPKAIVKPAGLLTTVDKVVPTQYGTPEPNVTSAHKNGAYFNRVPVEAKDVILQKIRQHIMDKRGNEHMNNANNIPAAVVPNETYYQRDTYQYCNRLPNYNDTLDLRKIRSPVKSVSPMSHSSEKAVPLRTVNQLEHTSTLTSSENKIMVSLPEQCEERPMDYSNLPPKKKRKLIEYQEYKKQEEAKRRLDALYNDKKDNKSERVSTEADDDTNQWRPW